MRSLVKTQKGKGFIEIQDRPMPSPGSGEVLIKVAYTGICGTDLHIFHDEFPYWPPVIMGHEFSGEIVKLGTGVKLFQVGDRVVGEPHNKACGNCYLCRTGNIQICDEKRSIGWGIDGAFASHLIMPESLLHRIPSNVSLQEAALMEPCAIVAHEVLERAAVRAGEKIVVMGMGPIGLLAAQMAKAAGADRVILTGCDSDEGCRLKAAKETRCMDRFVNIQREDLEEVVRSETGVGADMVIEASGAGAAIRSAVALTKKRGRICAIGMNGKPTIEFPWDAAMKKAIDIHFNMSSSYTGWEIALGLLASGKLNVKPLISQIRPIDEWNSAFEDIAAGRAIKVLLTAQ